MKKLSPPLFVLSLLLFSCGSGFGIGMLEDIQEGAELGLESQALPEDNKLAIPIFSVNPASGAPFIDGKVDDTFWSQARPFELDIELYPERMAPAPVRTEAKLAVTRTHLYVAFIAHDPRPDQIRSALRERDAGKEDDYVSIIIDPTGSLARKYEFRVNPDGTLADVLQDEISDRYIYDWDTRWEGAARRTETGYTVEMAIPANAIHASKQSAGGSRPGLVILKRSYPRSVDAILATFFLYKRAGGEAGGVASSLTSVYHMNDTDRSLEFIPRKLLLTPHYIYHIDQSRPIGGKYEQVEDRDEHRAGLDAEYSFSTSRSLAVTVNPNFTEVEADLARQSIDNPFTVFQPEKRAFFKTATEYYNSIVPLVYTRNIIQPRFGASYVTDYATHSFATFATDDRETSVIVPDSLGSGTVELQESSYSSAFRFRNSENRQTTAISGTYRAGEDYYNGTMGFDGMVDLGPDDKFRYQLSFSGSKYSDQFEDYLCAGEQCPEVEEDEPCLLGSCETNPLALRTEPDTLLHGHALQVRYKHDGPSGLYWFGYEQLSPDYRADLGFLRRVDIRSFNFAYGKKMYFQALQDDEEKSRFRTYMLGQYIRSFEEDDKLEQGLSFWGEFRGSFQSVLRVGYWFRNRAVNRIDQSSLAVGENAPLFDERYTQWYFETAPFASWKLHLDGRVGKTANPDNLVLGDMLELQPRITFRIGPLELNAGGTFRDFQLDDSRLYKERFLSFSALYRSDRNIVHRLLYLDDLTKRDQERWLGPALAREYEKTVEYTLIYKPSETWKILTGIKAQYSYESDIDDGDFTDRQLYCKIEKTF